MKTPWAISEADAKVREEKARADERRDLIALCQRIIVPDMPDDTIMFRLAAHGYDSERLRKVLSG